MAIKKIADLGELRGLLASTDPDKIIKKGSCRVIRPIVEKMSKKHQDVVFVEADIDESRDVAVDLGISSTPTFHFYKATDKIDGFSGADETKLPALTEKYLRTE
ncbi:Thioredoxin-2 [Mortierella alpina]|nr:Thioredoxin-2 [Mortierella alpina]